jgi:hypothetical protein
VGKFVFAEIQNNISDKNCDSQPEGLGGVALCLPDCFKDTHSGRLCRRFWILAF